MRNNCHWFAQDGGPVVGSKEGENKETINFFFMHFKSVQMVTISI